MYEAGDVKTFNPAKEISKEITLEILIRHRDALKQARTGEVFGVEMNKVDDNTRKINQVRALNLIISAQREMVTISRPIIFFRSTQKWKKKYKEEKDQLEHPFDKDENDYNSILDWLDFLKKCEYAILEAEKSKTKDDDFLIVRQKTEGDVNELTRNFYEMVNDLEQSYEQIYLLMLTNKIVSAGIEEDESDSYSELEEEAMKRVIES
jgi:hypothetical protein